MSDTWSDIQAIKNKHSSRREKLQRLKRAREELVAGITAGPSSAVTVAAAPAVSEAAGSPRPIAVQVRSTRSLSPAPLPPPCSKPDLKVDPQFLADIEAKLQLILSDITLNFPVEGSYLLNVVTRGAGCEVPLSAVEDLLQKFAAQQLISINSKDDVEPGQSKLIIVSADHGKLSAVSDELETKSELDTGSRKRKRDGGEVSKESGPQMKQIKQSEAQKDDSIESLLSMQSAKEKENKRLNEEILQLLSTPTAKEQSLVEKFRSQGGAQVQEFCQYGIKEECQRVRVSLEPCGKLHFKKILRKHTDESLGDCSFLNTCFHMDSCKYVHYEIDYPEQMPGPTNALSKLESIKKTGTGTMLFPNQWVQCDLRKFDMSVLGKFAVVMADPPWDIHMELPYGTMSDDEMRKLDVPSLQDDGYIFLWVTGRAMELGRECLKLWGYERIDEMIWVKTNQLQRIIRTGRTGHWLNHGKEHCLVGCKGNPKNVNRGLDCDVIVAEVRATSHKPDEIYGIIERLCPGTRKIELFGRPHNIQPNWITLGNQLDGVRLLEPEVVKAFRKRYPDGDCMKPSTQK